MSGTALLEIHNTVRSTLEADATLAALVTGVFDHVPTSQPFPYLVLGEKSETGFATFGRGGIRATLVIEVRSRAAGDAEILAVYDRLKEVLDGQPLSLTEYTVVSSHTSLLRTVLDPDGITRRAESKLEVLAQEA